MYFIREIDRDELPQWQRTRTDIYLLEGFITKSQLNSHGLYVDGEDVRSIHIAAFEPFGRMIGTFRLIMRTRGWRLPVERDFGIRYNGKYVAAELSGLAVDPHHRNGMAMIGLLRGMYDLLISNRVHTAYAELEKPLFGQLNMLGFPFTKIGNPKTVYNTVNWPTQVVVSQILSGLTARDAGRQSASYAPFFSRHFDGVVTPACIEPTPITMEGAS